MSSNLAYANAMAMLEAVYVVDAVRTPIGRYGGALSECRPDDLAAEVISALVRRQPALTEALEQVVFGATNQAGEDNRNVARMASLVAGLPYEVPGVTVNRLCGSGLEAVADAYRRIATGEAEVVLAGGVESMTRAPYVMAKAQERFSRNPPALVDTSLGWRFPNPRMESRFPLISMGETAELVAEKWGIDRQAQDAFALKSHMKAAAAWRDGRFAAEIIPVAVKPARGEAIEVRQDESVRAETTQELLARLKPVFRPNGSVTAGNSSPLNDGAAGLLLCSERALRASGAQPLARIAGQATAGLDPIFMGEGPIHAVRKLFARTDWKREDLDLIELNEAFAAQALACIKGLDFDPERVNVHGGAIALGHPIGCSGARIACTLVHAMKARGAKRGLASLCIGVGQGIAMLFEGT